MAEQLQFRHGTTEQHSTFTGAVAEITIDTDKDVAVVHDGTTVGGHPLAKQSSVDLKANDNAVVKLTGDQTVDGIKTHTSIPVVPAVSPTTDNQVTRKKYVDDGLALKTGIGTATPLAPAVTAVVGVSTNASRQDHVHPTNFTATATDIKMDGVQAVGTLTTYPRADHVHPSDTSKANLASPTLTGTPLSTTAAVGTNTTQIATTAFVNAEITNDTYVKDTANWRDTMMSKAEFNAVAKQESRNNAGSGFIEFGKHVATLNINEGITASSTWASYFALGRTSSAAGTSKTNYSIANINGTLNYIKYLNSTDEAQSNIILPPAPTVLPSTATLTQQQIDSGVIKHADASNSGLIVNGKFDTDTSGWTAPPNYPSTAVVVDGKLRLTATSVFGRQLQAIPTVIGKTYIVNGTATLISGGGSASINLVTSAGGDILLSVTSFVATATTSYISCALVANGSIGDFDNISVFPSDAIRRSDLVFLEAWHEDVSEKDFVYPLGNVQYLGTTGDSGTPVAGAFAGSATYSLFSDTWQADSALVGKGYVWSTLSDANKKAFVANPENNCYLDGDKVIHVRYRMRVQLGEDTWTMAKATVQGKAVTASTTLFTVPVTTVDAGLYSNTSTTYTYTGTTTSAIEICRIHRRNQGMMHPIYNPNGTKLASDSLPWYSTTVSFTSIADCFTESKLLATSGYIGTTTGRPDGIFYDQVHEGDITDLRNNSAKVQDYNRLIDKEFNKLVAGTYRGSQGELNTEVKTQTTTGTIATVEVNDGTKYKSGDTIYIYDLTAIAVKGRFTVKSISTNTLTVDVAFAKLANSYMISGGSTTRTKSNTITMTDMVGSPSNLPVSMKLDGQSFNTLHTAEDGTSLLPTGTTGSDGLAVFKLSRDANATPLQVLKSTDSGATWIALTVTTHYTFNTTTNAITFTSGNIPLAAHLIMVTYQTHTNMAVAAVNSEVLAIGDVYADNVYLTGALGQSLIGKVLTTSGNGYYCKLINFMKLATNLLYAGVPPIHTIGTIGTSSNAPSVKVFPYLTRSNGKARLNLVFAEMKYGSYLAPTTVTAASATYTINLTYKVNIAGCALDGKVIQWSATTTTVAIDWSLYDVSPTGVIYLLSSGAVYSNARLYDGDSWGDSGKFSIVDNVSTTTDLNGQTILIGQKSVELPFFIGASE